MIFDTGAEIAGSDREAFERLSLLAPELDLSPQLEGYERKLRQKREPAAVEAAIAASRDERPLALIKRFASGEADIGSPDPKGLGRVSTKGFPRLGATLHKATRSGDPEVATEITRAVERTVHASYLSTFLFVANYAERERTGTESAIWEMWIQNAYVAPDQLTGGVLGYVAIEQFWAALLEKLEVRKAKKLMKRNSPLARSLGGLTGVGASLMIAERKR